MMDGEQCWVVGRTRSIKIYYQATQSTKLDLMKKSILEQGNQLFDITVKEPSWFLRVKKIDKMLLFNAFFAEKSPDKIIYIDKIPLANS